MPIAPFQLQDGSSNNLALMLHMFHVGLDHSGSWLRSDVIAAHC